MENKLFAILEERNESINYDKVKVDFNENSIEIMGIDEEGYNLYGTTHYSAEDAYDRLKVIGAIEGK